MSTCKTFRDFEVYQKARALALAVYHMTSEGSFSKDWTLKDQMLRASASIKDNLAEGFERDGTREFIQFIGYAKGSAGEVRSQLDSALDRGHITVQDFQKLDAEAETIGKMLKGLTEYLKRAGHSGLKFKPPETRNPKPETKGIRPQNRRSAAGAAIISTLLVLTVLTVMVVAFLQSMRIDRLTARAYLNKTKATLVANAALEEAVETLRLDLENGLYTTGFAYDTSTSQRDLARPVIARLAPATGAVASIQPLTSSDTGSITGRILLLPGQSVAVPFRSMLDQDGKEAGRYGYWIDAGINRQPLHLAGNSVRRNLADWAELPLFTNNSQALTAGERATVVAARNLLPTPLTMNLHLGAERVDTLHFTTRSPHLLLSREGYPKLNLKQLKDYIDGGSTEYEGFPLSADEGYPGLPTTQGPTSPRVQLIDQLLDSTDTDSDETNNFGYFVMKPWGYGSLKWLRTKYTLEEARQIVANIIDYIDSDFIPTCDALPGSTPALNNTSNTNNIIPRPTPASLLGVEARVVGTTIQTHPYISYVGTGFICNAGTNHINSTRTLAYLNITNPSEGNSQPWTTFYRTEFQFNPTGSATYTGGSGPATDVFRRGWVSQESTTFNYPNTYIPPYTGYLYPRSSTSGNDLANGFNTVNRNNVIITNFALEMDQGRLIYIQSGTRFIVQDISALQTVSKPYPGGTFTKNNTTTLVNKLRGSGPVQNDYWLNSDPRLNFQSSRWSLATPDNSGSTSSSVPPLPTTTINVGLGSTLAVANGPDGQQNANNDTSWYLKVSDKTPERHFPTYTQGYRPSPATNASPMTSLADLGFIHAARPWQTLRIHRDAQTPGQEDWRFLDYLHTGQNLPGSPSRVELSVRPPSGTPIDSAYPHKWTQVAEGGISFSTAHRPTLLSLFTGMPVVNGADNYDATPLADALLAHDPGAANGQLILSLGDIWPISAFNPGSSFDFEKEQFLGRFSNAFATKPITFTIYVHGESRTPAGKRGALHRLRVEVLFEPMLGPGDTLTFKPRILNQFAE